MSKSMGLYACMVLLDELFSDENEHHPHHIQYAIDMEAVPLFVEFLHPCYGDISNFAQLNG